MSLVGCAPHQDFIGGRYKIRDDLAYQNLKDLSLRVQPHDKISAAGTVNIFNANMDDSLTWDFVTWVRTITDLPIFVKVIRQLAHAFLLLELDKSACTA